MNITFKNNAIKPISIPTTSFTLEELRFKENEVEYLINDPFSKKYSTNIIPYSNIEKIIIDVKKIKYFARVTFQFSLIFYLPEARTFEVNNLTHAIKQLFTHCNSHHILLDDPYHIYDILTKNPWYYYDDLKKLNLSN